jgi:hypothetical protein
VAFGSGVLDPFSRIWCSLVLGVCRYAAPVAGADASGEAEPGGL